jgi:uncharacterized protein YjiS (DUF1127 family)
MPHVNLKKTLNQLVENQAARARRRSALAELNNLTDRELADIGITRSDLPQIVKDM